MLFVLVRLQDAIGEALGIDISNISPDCAKSKSNKRHGSRSFTIS
jgi:hypothetical protein